MSRPARIEFPDAYYHVMNRGRARQNIFHTASDFERFLTTLEEASSRFSIEVHAYCLMTNHYHLLIKTPLGNLQRAMRHIGGVYTQRYNRSHRTDGALFRGRYKSILVDSDEYLLHLSKYIHLNPVEAKMVGQLDSYRWSSYPAFVGKQKSPTWLKTNEVYEQLNARRNIKKKYREFVEEQELLEDIVVFYDTERTSPVLGDKQFAESALTYIGEFDAEVLRANRRMGKPTIDELVSEVAVYFDTKIEFLTKSAKGRGARNTPRKVAMYVAQQVGDHRLSDIAEYFGLQHYGGVSSAISDITRRMRDEKQLRNQLKDIIKRFDP
jgi:putative transposase